MPPGRTRPLGAMVRLACEDEPALVCLQELPAAALGRLEAGSGYQARGEVAMRPRLPAEIAYRITNLRPGLLRSAVEGQANAILFAPGLRVLEHRSLVLNPRRFRRREAERLGLDLRARLAWAKERRVCHAARVKLPNGRIVLVANLHATSYRADPRLADTELLRAARFATGVARPEDDVVLAGDFNVTARSSPTLRALAGADWGFSAPSDGIDHILVRGLEVVEPLSVWPQERRLHEGRLLSDHAPVELRVR